MLLCSRLELSVVLLKFSTFNRLADTVVAEIEDAVSREELIVVTEIEDAASKLVLVVVLDRVSTLSKFADTVEALSAVIEAVVAAMLTV